jgi:hypothetical protein
VIIDVAFVVANNKEPLFKISAVDGTMRNSNGKETTDVTK